jgi:hypothetical protein
MGQLICHVARFIYEVNFLELRQSELRRIYLLETVWKVPIGLDLEYSE